MTADNEPVYTYEKFGNEVAVFSDGTEIMRGNPNTVFDATESAVKCLCDGEIIEYEGEYFCSNCEQEYSEDELNDLAGEGWFTLH